MSVFSIDLVHFISKYLISFLDVTVIPVEYMQMSVTLFSTTAVSSLYKMQQSNAKMLVMYPNGAIRVQLRSEKKTNYVTVV